MKRLFFLFVLMPFAIFVLADADVPFTLSGLQSGDKVSLTISSNEYLTTMSVTANGDYSFSNVPTGQHSIKVEANGYNLPDSKLINVKEDGTIEPFTVINLVVTKMDEDDSKWTHSWHEDGSLAGYTTTAYVNKPAELIYLGKKIVPADVPLQSGLKADYHVILSDEGAKWTQEYAYRLLETLKMFPGVYGDTLIISLTTEHIEDDIEMEDSNGGKLVTLATEAFAYANPYLVDLDGVRGRFFSKRLHHAIANLLTNYGKRKDVADRIFQQRFGCSINPPSYEELTSGTTNEGESSFQEFAPSELVEILSMFEEMPEGFHKIPGLNYIIRRQNGHPHPLYPGAAAVTWAENGYIEFMYSAFFTEHLFDTHRLIIHEKTHMLWAHSFSEEIKNDWIEVGGWYLDPNSSSGWSTTKDTEFVTSYAHGINPNEDMAESVAFYIKNPDMLQSRSLPKYEFIRDRIMHGTRYISKIREDLTFEVLNLFPDYDYPGKINGLDIQVLGKPEEDKRIIIDITLNHIEGLQDGASAAVLRCCSSIGESDHLDVVLYPVDDDEHHLRGEITASKYRKSGYWTFAPVGSVVKDEHGNERYGNSNDFVWNLYINNPLEDLIPPVIDVENLEYEMTDMIVDGHNEKLLRVRCEMTDNIRVEGYGCNIWTLEEEPTFFSLGMEDYNEDTHEATMRVQIPDYWHSCDYYISSVEAYDAANNRGEHTFYPETRPIIHITTTNPDYEAPEIDLNRISIYAEPVNKEAPDGETIVTINFYTRDNNSGVTGVDCVLRDPQGIDHHFTFSPPDRGDRYPSSDPTVWQHSTERIILPKGSAPGIWGMAYMSTADRAGNGQQFDFVETLIFEPDVNQEDYILFAEMTSKDMLSFDLSAISANMEGYIYSYRIISEVTGDEIKGVIEANTSNSRSARHVPSNGYNIDVSSLPMGKIVVIVEIKDGDGNTVAVRSKSLIKCLSGDISNDGAVDVSDYIGVANHILGNTPDGFNALAADVNEDGVVDVSDYIGIANIILTGSIYGNSNAARILNKETRKDPQ